MTSSHPQDVDGDCCASPTDVMSHTNLGTIDLAPPGFSPELADYLADLLNPRSTNGVAARLEPSTRVDRQVTIEGSDTLPGELPCLALLAESEILYRTNFGYGEAIPFPDNTFDYYPFNDFFRKFESRRKIQFQKW